LDIKTVLIKDIDDLIVNNNTLYTVIGKNNNAIYQGVLCVYPRNNIIGKLINQCIGVNHMSLIFNYALFTEFFYKCITSKLNVDKLLPGRYLGEDFNIHLFKEKECPISDCITPDKYGGCYFIYDTSDAKIIKTRYSDFPW
jgi:hypothetical protein